MNDLTSVPDLQNGYLLNGTENLWVAEIQCVLQLRGHNDKNIYLSQECRMERLPLSTTYLGGGTDIFQVNQPSEFLSYKDGNDFFQIAQDEIICFHPSGSGDGTPPPSQLYPECESRAYCDDRPFVAHTIETLHDGLLNGFLKVRDLFLYITWKTDQTEYRLFTPCRYINFSNPDFQDLTYVQPISGTVLFPLGDRYIPASIACAMDNNGVQLIEFCSQAFRDVGEWHIKKKGFEAEEAAIIRNFQNIMPSYFLARDHITKIDGTARIFSYREC